MKKQITLIVGIIMLIVSATILLYPTISNLLNKMCNNTTIEQYHTQVDLISDENKEKLLSEAKKYNENLNNNVSDAFSVDAFNINPSYEDILAFTEDGQIGTVQIPKINVNLPVFHGTNEKTLEKGAVHMANTSFPIGGKNTNAVISAHTAFPGKIFFDDLDKLEIGNKFTVTVLDNTLTYKVCDIYVVEPYTAYIIIHNISRQ